MIIYSLISLFLIDNLLKKSNRKNVTYKMIEDYSVRDISIKKAVRDIRKNYSQIKREKVFYETFDISKYFYQQMDFHLFYYGLSNYIYYIESISKAPQNIVLTLLSL